jgi:periplasmic protein CpxP/Spy
MKKFLLMCCLFVCIAAASHAQGGGRRFNPEDRAKQLQTELKLSDEQTTKVTAIYKAQFTKMDSLRKAGGDFRSSMRPLMDSTNKQVKAILTPEQATAFDKAQQERMNRMRQGGGGGGPQ